MHKKRSSLLVPTHSWGLEHKKLHLQFRTHQSSEARPLSSSAQGVDDAPTSIQYDETPFFLHVILRAQNIFRFTLSNFSLGQLDDKCREIPSITLKNIGNEVVN